MRSMVLISMVGIQAAGAVLSFVSILMLTAALGAEAYGLYAWIVSIGAVGSLIVQRGLPLTIVKRFSPFSLQKLECPSPLVNTQIFYVLAAIVTLFITAIVTIAIRPDSVNAAVWAFPIALAMASFTVADAILRSAERGARAQIAGQILRPGLLLAGTLGLWYVGNDQPGPYLALYSATFLAATVAFLWSLVARGLSKWRGGGLMRSNAAHFQVSISRSVGNYLPVFITGFFVAPENLAYLAIAIRLTGPTRFGLNAARAHFGARINRSIKAKNYDRARADYDIAARFSVSVAFLIAAFSIGLVYTLAVLQQGPLASFNPVQLTMVMAITALSHLVFSMFGPAQLVAVLLGNETYVRNLNVVLLVLFALGLLLAAVAQEVLVSAVVMVLYSLCASGGVALKVRTNFNTLQKERATHVDVS